MAERGRHEQRVNTRPAGNEDMHIFGSVGDADMIRVANFREPPRSPVMQALHTAFRKAAQRNSGALKHRLLNCFFVDAVAVERRRMFRAEHEHWPGRENNIVVTERRHRTDEMIQNFRARLTTITEDIVWS